MNDAAGTPEAGGAPDTLEVRVAGIADLTARIRQFELVSDGTALPTFEAGAHVEITVGQGVTRFYSLCNDPRERHRYVLAVLREPQGVGSGWMHDAVKVGDRLTIHSPRNAFPLDETAAEHILIAGGVGITPIRSMAFRLAATGATYRLIYCSQSAEDTAFRADLLEAHGARLHLHHDAGDPTRRIDLAATLRHHPEGAHVYVCGPKPMVDAVRMATIHWPAGTVHVEIFSSPAKPKAYVNEAFEVELARSGRVLQVPADRTLLEVLLAAGVKASYVCREGHCSTCGIRLLAGLADHRDDVMDDDEKAEQKTIYVCVSRAVPGERLVIDR
jgi:ferredoxin-NADP reductase